MELDVLHAKFIQAVLFKNMPHSMIRPEQGTTVRFERGFIFLRHPEHQTVCVPLANVSSFAIVEQKSAVEQIEAVDLVNAEPAKRRGRPAKSE